MNKKIFIDIYTNNVNKAKKIIRDSKTKKIKIFDNITFKSH